MCDLHWNWEKWVTPADYLISLFIYFWSGILHLLTVILFFNPRTAFLQESEEWKWILYVDAKMSILPQVCAQFDVLCIFYIYTMSLFCTVWLHWGAIFFFVKNLFDQCSLSEAGMHIFCQGNPHNYARAWLVNSIHPTTTMVILVLLTSLKTARFASIRTLHDFVRLLILWSFFCCAEVFRFVNGM